MRAEPFGPMKLAYHEATDLEQEKYKEYQKISSTMGQIWTNLKKFGDGTLKKILQDKVEKGYNYDDKLAGMTGHGIKRGDKPKVMEEYIKHLFSEYEKVIKYYNKNTKYDEFKPKNPLEYDPWCLDISYNEYVNKNLNTLYNNYIRLSKHVEKKFGQRCKEDWKQFSGSLKEGGKKGKGGFNRLLYYVFDKDDLEYNKIEDTVTAPNNPWNCGQRIMDILFLQKFRIANWDDVSSPIVLYESSTCKISCPGEIYISGNNNTTYTITANKFLDILIKSKNNNSSKRKLWLLIRMNTEGKIVSGDEKMDQELIKVLSQEFDNNPTNHGAKNSGKDTIQGVLKFTKIGDTKGGYENNETLLIKEKDVHAYAITGTEIKEAGGWKANLDKMFGEWYQGSGIKSKLPWKKSDQKSREKKAAAASAAANKKKEEERKKNLENEEKKIQAEAERRKKKLQNKSDELFHNETILYAQPVERHYSPMERVSRGMDKVELEDVTFKF